MIIAHALYCLNLLVQLFGQFLQTDYMKLDIDHLIVTLMFGYAQLLIHAGQQYMNMS